jgi:ATP-dependent DNA helicase RecG
VHRDYTNPTDVIIVIFDYIIEVTNTGKLMGDLSIEKLNSGDYVYQHRNKLLTEVFYLTEDIEKYGTGFKRVKEWFSEYPNLKYVVSDLPNFIQVKISSKLVNERINLLLH